MLSMAFTKIYFVMHLQPIPGDNTKMSNMI